MLLVPGIYFVAFFCLMDVTVPAVSGEGRLFGHTCTFRFKEAEPMVINEKTQMIKTSSFLNVIFYPAELTFDHLVGRGDLLADLNRTSKSP